MFFSRARLKSVNSAGPPTHTQWNVSLKMKILLKWVFSLYTEITLKSDLYFISSFPAPYKKKIKFLLFKTAFNDVYLM